jgi:sterol desaturase/sphingolipid hydroxylase (fatty acid hydroxylase superfamily)
VPSWDYVLKTERKEELGNHEQEKSKKKEMHQRQAANSFKPDPNFSWEREGE